MEAIAAILVIGLGYLAGGIPWGVVLGRLLAGVDVRGHGSGSTGATNVLRVAGWRISVAVLVLDFLKGLVPVLLARATSQGIWVVALTAVATVVGHCWSPYIGFTGGKGMATGSGAAAAIVPWVLLLVPLMVLVVLLTRYVSLGSILTSAVAGIAVMVAAGLGYAPLAAAGAMVAIAAIIVSKHRANIRRLLAGTERRFGERTGPAPSPAADGRP